MNRRYGGAIFVLCAAGMNVGQGLKATMKHAVDKALLAVRPLQLIHFP
jgi:hypothetical protein